MAWEKANYPLIFCKDSEQSLLLDSFPFRPYFHRGQSCPTSVEPVVSHLTGIVSKSFFFFFFFTLGVDIFLIFTVLHPHLLNNLLGLCEAKQRSWYIKPFFSVSLDGNYMLEFRNHFWTDYFKLVTFFNFYDPKSYSVLSLELILFAP